VKETELNLIEENQTDGILDHRDILLAFLAGLLALALYVRTLAPWVLPGDSGEFQFDNHGWGDGTCCIGLIFPPHYYRNV
jgi:hypothetical protein